MPEWLDGGGGVWFVSAIVVSLGGLFVFIHLAAWRDGKR